MQQKHCNTAGRESTAKNKTKTNETKQNKMSGEGKSSALTKFELFPISKCTFCLWQTATAKVRDTQSDSSPVGRPDRPTDRWETNESGAEIREWVDSRGPLRSVDLCVYASWHFSNAQLNGMSSGSGGDAMLCGCDELWDGHVSLCHRSIESPSS